MKKFIYSFESILKYKNAQESEARQNLGAANSKCEKLKNKIKENSKLILENSKIRSSSSISDMVYSSNYTAKLEFENKDSENMLKIREIEKDKVLKEYNTRYKEARVFNLLKEKSFMQHKEKALKQQYSVLDDIFASKKSQLKDF